MRKVTPTLTVVEASPLISFLKINRFDIIEALGGRFACTAHVRSEVVQFKQQAHLEILLNASRIVEVDIDDPALLKEFARLIEETPLGPGEASSILYAESEGCPLLITDRKGIREAKKRGVTCITTQEVVVRAIGSGYLTVDGADALIMEWARINEFPVSVKTFKGAN